MNVAVERKGDRVPALDEALPAARKPALHVVHPPLLQQPQVVDPVAALTAQSQLAVYGVFQPLQHRLVRAGLRIVPVVGALPGAAVEEGPLHVGAEQKLDHVRELGVEIHQRLAALGGHFLFEMVGVEVRDVFIDADAGHWNPSFALRGRITALAARSWLTLSVPVRKYGDVFGCRDVRFARRATEAGC